MSHAVCDDSVALKPLIQIIRALFSDDGDMTGRSGHDTDDGGSPAGLLGYLPWCLCWPRSLHRMTQCLAKIKGPSINILTRVIMNDGGLWDVRISMSLPAMCAGMEIHPTVIGLRASVGGSAASSDWLGVLGPADEPPGGICIRFIWRTVQHEQSIVTVTVTGSLDFLTLANRRDAEYCDTAWNWPLLCRTDSIAMDAAGFSIVDNRAGVTFGVELYMPWDAPEMSTDLSAKGTVPLRDVQDVFGLCGRREGAIESRILQGRDARSVRVLVPDPRGLEQNFHDVMVVDMGDSPESEVSIPELSDLTGKWPPAVIAHMRWRQPELEEMQQAARLKYRKKQPAQCDFCSRTIRCDMYRHVAPCHLDLAQLWRCPVAWCTVWKGALQDLTDHVRYAHRVPEEVQNVRLEKLIPPWTVTRKVYTESLTSRHSGISNDILLFGDIGMTLSHHYRVHKKGVPPRRVLQDLPVSVARNAAPACGSVWPEGIAGVRLFDDGGVAGGCGRLPPTIKTCVRSPTRATSQGDTHTNCTPPDRVRPTGRGYGV